jgi:hypothetical protein
VALALGWVGGTKIEHSTWQMSTNLVVRCWAASQNGTKNIDEGITEKTSQQVDMKSE